VRLLKGFWLITRMDKPIGIYLLLWPTLWAVFLASLGQPQWDVLAIFVAGVVVMRAAGCVINDIADRKVDGHVARTDARPLITGLLSTREALAMFALLLVVALSLVLQLNLQTFYLSWVALLLASSYPFMKRYTHLPQVVLGAAFSWSIPMAFMAINQYIPSWAWYLYLANLAWTVAYDTAYAMVDRDDDLKVGVKSTAILFGAQCVPAIGLLYLVCIGAMSLLGWELGLSAWYWLTTAVAGLVMLWFVMRLQRAVVKHDRAEYFAVFKANHWIGLLFLAGICASLWFPIT
jgi:4-hydroxybenzoate polyprenyltransferase